MLEFFTAKLLFKKPLNSENSKAMIVYLNTMYLISKFIFNWILFLQFWKGLWWGNSTKKKFWNWYHRNTIHIFYRFSCKMINLSNNICHTRDQPLTCGGGDAIVPFVLLQHVSVICGELLGIEVLCWNTYTYLYGLPLAERRCASVMDLLSMYSANGFEGGGWQYCLWIITNDLQSTRGMENRLNCRTRIL